MSLLPALVAFNGRVASRPAGSGRPNPMPSRRNDEQPAHEGYDGTKRQDVWYVLDHVFATARRHGGEREIIDGEPVI
jgi:hypothetical protein